MPVPRCVVIYGNTVALAGIAIALRQEAGLSVVTLDADSAEAIRQLEIYAPEVVIFDQSQTEAYTILSRLEEYQAVLAIGIEPNSDRMFLWSGQTSRAHTIHDLVQAISQLISTT